MLQVRELLSIGHDIVFVFKALKDSMGIVKRRQIETNFASHFSRKTPFIPLASFICFIPKSSFFRPT